MCGIAGIINKNEKVEFNQLKKMTDIIQHRGPDGEGHWIKKNIGLGHRRLSIIDLSENASQPMHSFCDKYVIILNGEIYNYIEIKETLLKKGYKFHSESDTEVLLNLYIEKGEKCLADLDGMFAFAIYNKQKQQLFCARDRFGEKPFYYYYEPGKTFIFASEMKAIFEAGVKKDINRKLVFRFLHANFFIHNPSDASETFFNGIKKLEASNYMIINKKIQVSKKRYWDIDYKSIDYNISFETATEQFRELFKTSVKRRLRSDVPVGSSLSGGLDSSAIVSAINQMNKGNNITQKTFSARFKNFEKDEGYFINKVIEGKNIEPFFTYPDENKLIEDLDKLLFHQEEPFGTASIFAQWEVMKLAEQNNTTVLLDGQGADEYLAGYMNYYHTYLNELFETDKQLFQKEKHFAKENLNIDFNINKSTNQKTKKGIKERIRKIKIIESVSHKIKRRNHLFTNDYWNYINDLDFKTEKNTLNQNLYHSTMQSGLERLLRFSDRNSMAFSREVRLPFLYHELVEFVFSLPASFKINSGWTKYILRESFKDILPQEITWRKDKIGYEPPQENWMKSSAILDKVKSAEKILEKEKILNPKRINKEHNKSWEFILAAHLYQ
jgi:asparagine synthase (glutamine-hydrolysing)